MNQAEIIKMCTAYTSALITNAYFLIINNKPTAENLIQTATAGEALIKLLDTHIYMDDEGNIDKVKAKAMIQEIHNVTGELLKKLENI